MENEPVPVPYPHPTLGFSYAPRTRTRTFPALFTYHIYQIKIPHGISGFARQRKFNPIFDKKLKIDENQHFDKKKSPAALIQGGWRRLYHLIFFTQGKPQKPKTRTYYVGHSVPVPYFSKSIRIRSVPAPKILKLIRTRTRTRTKFSKNFRTRHVYATKNHFFSLPVLSSRSRRILSTHSGPSGKLSYHTKLIS